LALCTDLGSNSINTLLPCVGFALLGSALSFEHLSSLSLQNQYHGSIKSIYGKLALPFIVATLLIIVISFV
jgi:hypothetical protein